MSALILTDTTDGVFEIRINRPEKKNALLIEMYAGMYDALVTAKEDASVKVVLFRGSDDAFTAGNDLMDFMQRPPIGKDAPVFKFMHELATFEKPVVAAVVGPAVGIGTTMLLHCDLVYAGASAQFKMPFVDLGLVPEFASSYMLPAKIGHQKAAEYLLLADAFDAQTAVDLGIANAMGSDEQAHDMARATAARLAKKAPNALKLSKQLMKAQTPAVLEHMQTEGSHFGALLQSPELQEAGRAFFEKREPDFTKFG